MPPGQSLALGESGLRWCLITSMVTRWACDSSVVIVMSVAQQAAVRMPRADRMRQAEATTARCVGGHGPNSAIVTATPTKACPVPTALASRYMPRTRPSAIPSS